MKEILYERFDIASRITLHKWTIDRAIVYTTDFNKWHIFDRSRGTEEHDISFDTLIVIMYEKEEMYYAPHLLETFIELVKDEQNKSIIKQIIDRPKLVVSD